MRGKIFLIALSGHILLNSGCTKNYFPPNDTLVIGLSDSPKTLDPRFAIDANGQRIIALLSNGLVQFNPRMELVGDLADKWTLQNNTYVFDLKPNLKFADGSDITDEDILATFHFHLTQKSPFYTTLSTIAHVTVSNSPNRQVKLKLKKYSAPLLGELTLIKILPKSHFDQTDYVNSFIGSGAFQLVNQTANQIVLEATPNHTYLKPKMKRIIFKIIQDDNTRFLQTLKGQIDVIQTGIPLIKVKYLEKHKDFKIYKYMGPSMNYLLLNFKDPLISNKATREALNWALNRNEIIEYKLEGYGVSATSLLPPNNPFYHRELVPFEQNLQNAKNIIETLPNKNLVFKTSNNQETMEISKIIAAQLQTVGFQIRLQNYEWGTFYGDINKGNFQIAMMRWVGLTDPDIYRVAFHSQETPPGRNRGQYKNPGLDTLLEKGLEFVDARERIKFYKKIQEVIYEDLAILPLWYNTQVSIVNHRIKNYNPSVLGDFLFALNVEKGNQ